MFRRPGRCQPLLEAEGGGLLESGSAMAVYVECGSHLGMAQALLDYLWMDTLPEHQSGVGMAGIVEPVAFESHLRQGLRRRTC